MARTKIICLLILFFTCKLCFVEAKQPNNDPSITQIKTVSFKAAQNIANVGLEAGVARKGCGGIAVSVVDVAGRELVLLKTDAGAERLVSEAFRKAWTAANIGVSTKELLALIQKNEGDDSQLPHIKGALFLMGGIPLKDGDY